uniref:Uncharacterized protein n=1 Tax=Arundo donax TaxID=35708 RepID=A0A0A9C5M7_ARUDO
MKMGDGGPSYAWRRWAEQCNEGCSRPAAFAATRWRSRRSWMSRLGTRSGPWTTTRLGAWTGTSSGARTELRLRTSWPMVGAAVGETLITRRRLERASFDAAKCGEQSTRRKGG